MFMMQKIAHLGGIKLIMVLLELLPIMIRVRVMSTRKAGDRARVRVRIRVRVTRFFNGIFRIRTL